MFKVKNRLNRIKLAVGIIETLILLKNVSKFKNKVVFGFFSIQFFYFTSNEFNFYSLTFFLTNKLS